MNPIDLLIILGVVALALFFFWDGSLFEIKQRLPRCTEKKQKTLVWMSYISRFVMFLSMSAVMVLYTLEIDDRPIFPSAPIQIVLLISIFVLILTESRLLGKFDDTTSSVL